VARTCNPSTQEAEAGGFQAEGSLGYIASPHVKKNQKGSGAVSLESDLF
jgi:hypothetical protein